MTEPTGDQRDIRKVRIGLAIISVVVVIAVVALFVVDTALGRAIMFAVAATAFFRAYGLIRWLRAEQAGNQP